MQRIFIMLLFCFSLLMAGVVHAKIYKWVDENGTIHMSDKPPKKGEFNEVKVKVNVIASPKRKMKKGADKQDNNNPGSSKKKVVMYGAEWCGVCKRAKRYFQSNGIPFTFE